MMRKFDLILFVTGCLLLCCPAAVEGQSLWFMDPFFISYEVTEGENVVIDCATFQEAYHTGLLYEYGQVPPFELVPDGKKLMRKDQIFTINNVTARDEGIYYCVAKDKQLVEYERKAGEIIFISSKPAAVDFEIEKSDDSPKEETVAMKLAASKPYLFFKQKSPLRINMKNQKPFELSVSAKGLQPIKLQWKKDDHELMIGSRYKTYDSGRLMTVDPPFTMEDGGTYSVSACNSKGCTVKGVQVLFYVIQNNTQMVQDDEEGSVEPEKGEGFIGNFLKKYGLLGIPLGIAIILVIAISCVSGEKEEVEEAPPEQETKIKIIEKIRIHKERFPFIKKKVTRPPGPLAPPVPLAPPGPSGGGRTASLWSWQSDSSGDEMPDYDKMKTKKKPPRKRSQMSHSSFEEFEQTYDHHVEYDEFHYETEGDHYDEAYGPGLHRQYSTDGEIYHDHDIMGYNEHGGQRESHTTIHIEDDDQPESSSYGHGHYGTTDIREQSHRYQDNGKRWSETGDSRHSYHTDETSDRGYDLDELIFASVNVQGGVQPMRAQVLQNREAQSSAVAQANAHVIDMYDDGEDFGFHPNVFEFD